jgi:hypothetical protein
LTILFALVSSPNPTDFKNDINIVFEHEWFKANLFSINFNKTHIIRFTAENKTVTDDICVCVCVCVYKYIYIHIYTHTYIYDNKQIAPITNTKFLGIFMNDTLTWKKHIQ